MRRTNRLVGIGTNRLIVGCGDPYQFRGRVGLECLSSAESIQWRRKRSREGHRGLMMRWLPYGRTLPCFGEKRPLSWQRGLRAFLLDTWVDNAEQIILWIRKATDILWRDERMGWKMRVWLIILIFVRSFVQLFVHSLCVMSNEFHSFVPLFVLWLFSHCIVNDAFSRSFLSSFTRVYSFINCEWCVHSFVHLVTHVFIRSIGRFVDRSLHCFLPPLTIQRMTQRTRNPNRPSWTAVVRLISGSAMQSPKWPVK